MKLELVCLLPPDAAPQVSVRAMEDALAGLKRGAVPQAPAMPSFQVAGELGSWGAGEQRGWQLVLAGSRSCLQRNCRC